MAASKDLELALEITAKNKTANTLKEVRSGMEAIEEEIQKLSQIAKGLKIDPEISAEDAKKKITELRDLYKSLEERSKLVEASTQPLSDKLRNIGDAAGKAAIVFGGITGTLGLVGHSLVDSAMKAESFRTAMISAFKGDKLGAAKLTSELEALADKTNFTTESVIKSGLYFKTFGIEAGKIPGLLTKIGDAASLMQVDLQTGVKAYTGALSGNFDMLKENFGVTKELIEKQLPQAVFNANGSIKNMEALVESLGLALTDKFGGGMEEASKTLQGQLSTLEGSLESLKAELGEQLLPTLKEITANVIDLVQTFRGLPDETKRTIIAVGGVATGISAAGLAISGLIAAAAPLASTITSLAGTLGSAGIAATAAGSSITNMVATAGTAGIALGPIGLTLIIGGLITAVGLLGTEWRKTAAIMEQQEIIKQTKELADLKNEINDITGVSEGFTSTWKRVVKALDEGGIVYAKTVEGQKLMAKTLELITKQAGPQRKRLDEVNQELEKTNELIIKFSNEIAGSIFHVPGLVKTKKELLEEKEALEKFLNKLDEGKDSLEKFEKAIDMKETFSKVKASFANIGESFSQIKSFKFEIDTKDLNKMIRDVKGGLEEQIAAIEGYKEKYKLTKEQEESIDYKLDELKEKLHAKEQKRIRERESAIKEFYSDYASQATLAAEKSIAAGENELEAKRKYLESIAKFLKDNAELLQENTGLRTEIETKYLQGINNLRKKIEKEEENRQNELSKAYEESAKKRIEAEKTAFEVRQKLLEAQAAQKGQAGIDAWLQKEIEALDEEYKALEKSGQEKNTLDVWYWGERSKLANDYYDKVKQEEINQTNEYIKSYNERLKTIDLLNQIALAEGTITQAQADRNKQNFIIQEHEQLKPVIEQLKEKEKLYGPGSFSDGESKLLEFLANEATSVKDINDLLKEKSGILDTNKEKQDGVTSSIKDQNTALKEQINLLEDAASKTGSGEVTTGLTISDLGGSGGYLSNLPGTGNYTMPSSYSPYGDSSGDYGRPSYQNSSNDYGRPSYQNSSNDYGRPSYAEPFSSDLGRAFGFDNPSHDLLAKKAGEAAGLSYGNEIIRKSTEDLIKHFLSGMVSSVQNVINKSISSFNTTNNNQSFINDNRQNNITNNNQLVINKSSIPLHYQGASEIGRASDDVMSKYMVKR